MPATVGDRTTGRVATTRRMPPQRREPSDASTDATPLVSVRGAIEPLSSAGGNGASPADAEPAVTLARLVGDTRPLIAAGARVGCGAAHRVGRTEIVAGRRNGPATNCP